MCIITILLLCYPLRGLCCQARGPALGSLSSLGPSGCLRIYAAAVHHILRDASSHAIDTESKEATLSFDDVANPLASAPPASRSVDQDVACAIATPVAILAALTPSMRQHLYNVTTTLSVLPRPVVDASLAALEHIPPSRSNGDGDDDEDDWLLRAMTALCSSAARCVDTAAAHVMRCCDQEPKNQTTSKMPGTRESIVTSACVALCKTARAIQAAAVDGESLLAAMVLEHQHTSETSSSPSPAVKLAQSWRWLQFSATLLLGTSDAAASVASATSEGSENFRSENGLVALAKAIKAVRDEILSRAVKLAPGGSASASLERDERTTQLLACATSLTLAPSTVLVIAEAASALHVAGQSHCGRGLAGALLREMLTSRRRSSSSIGESSSSVGNSNLVERENAAIPDFVLDDSLWDDLALFVDGSGGSTCDGDDGIAGKRKGRGFLAALSETLFKGDLSMRRAVLYALTSNTLRSHRTSATNDTNDEDDNDRDRALDTVTRHFQTRGSSDKGLGAQLLAQQLEDQVPLRRNFAMRGMSEAPQIVSQVSEGDSDDSVVCLDRSDNDEGVVEEGERNARHRNQLSFDQVSLLLEAVQSPSSKDGAKGGAPHEITQDAAAIDDNLKVLCAIVAARTSIDRLAKRILAVVARMHAENTRRCDDATSEAERLAEIAKSLRAEANITNKPTDHRKLAASKKTGSKGMKAAATEAEAAAAVAAVVASSVEASSAVPEFVVQPPVALLSLLSVGQPDESVSSILETTSAIVMGRAFSILLFRTILSLGGPECLGNVLSACRDHSWAMKAIFSVLVPTQSPLPLPLAPFDAPSTVRERLRVYTSESANSGPAATVDCTSLALNNSVAWHALQSVQNALDVYHGTIAAISQKEEDNAAAASGSSAGSINTALSRAVTAAATEVIKVLENALASTTGSGSSSAEALEPQITSSGTIAAVTAVALIFDSLFPVVSASKVVEANRSFLRRLAVHATTTDDEDQVDQEHQVKGSVAPAVEQAKQRLSLWALSVATAFCDNNSGNSHGQSSISGSGGGSSTTSTGSGCTAALLQFATQAKATHNDISYAFALARMTGSSAVELAPRCLKLAMHLGLVRDNGAFLS